MSQPVVIDTFGVGSSEGDLPKPLERFHIDGKYWFGFRLALDNGENIDLLYDCEYRAGWNENIFVSEIFGDPIDAELLSIKSLQKIPFGVLRNERMIDILDLTKRYRGDTIVFEIKTSKGKCHVVFYSTEIDREIITVFRGEMKKSTFGSFSHVDYTENSRL